MFQHQYQTVQKSAVQASSSTNKEFKRSDYISKNVPTIEHILPTTSSDRKLHRVHIHTISEQLIESLLVQYPL